MGAVLKKIKADLTSRPLISGLILVTIVVASALLTLAIAILLNIGSTYDTSFEALNAAHLWLYFDHNMRQRRVAEQVEALPNVTASTGLRYGVENQVSIGDHKVWTSIRMLPEPAPTVNRLLVREGRYPRKYKREILVSKDLREMYDLTLGDTLNITTEDGEELSLQAVGFAYNPMWDTYRNTQPPYLYATEADFKRWFPDKTTWQWALGVRLGDPDAIEQTLQRVRQRLPHDAMDVYVDWRDVRASAVFGSQLDLMFLGSFSFFAVLSTVLIITTSISSQVLGQFRQIGILKSIGFARNQVLALYIGQYLTLSLIGAPLGLLLGSALSLLPLKNVSASLSAIFQPPINATTITGVLTLVPSIVVVATWRAARQGAQANIVEAIATGAEPPRKKEFFGARLAARMGLPISFSLGLNDVFVKPLRSFLTGLNLILGVMGIVFGLTLSETLNTYRADPSLLGIFHDAIAARETTSDKHARHLLAQTPGVETFFTQTFVDTKTTDGDTFRTKIVSGDLEAFAFRITEGRTFRPTQPEAIAGRGFMDWLGLDVGDEITVAFDEQEHRPVTVRIVGTYPEPTNSGQMLMLGSPAVRHILSSEPAYTYYLKLKSDANLNQVEAYLQNEGLSVRLIEEAIPQSVIYLQMAMFGLSAILIGIALINIFNTSLLAVQEKIRTVGILKTVGMTPRQVVSMVNVTAGTLGVAAAVVGIPLGLAFTKGMLDTLSSLYGFGKVNVAPNLLYIALLIPLMVLISVLGSYLPGRWAAQSPITDVMRRE